jgi:hypothetical protein
MNNRRPNLSRPRPELVSRCIEAWHGNGEVVSPCRAWCEISLELDGQGVLATFIYLRSDSLALLAVYSMRDGQLYFEEDRTAVFTEIERSLCHSKMGGLHE